MTSNEWPSIALGDIGKIITGKTPSSKNKDYFGDKYKFITPRDMNGYKKITVTERYISEEGLQTLNTQIIKGKSVVVSCIGSDMGKVAIVEGTFVTNQQINTITEIGEQFNADFIYYALLPKKNYLHSIAGGSTMPIVNKSSFSEIEITMPSLEKQTTIAHVLSNLDEKIEVNNQMIAILEEIAATLFKHWFVDFEFPNEDGKPYKSSGGKMVESEIGEIPISWNTDIANNIAEIKIGKTPPRKEAEWFSKENGMKWVSISDMGKTNCFIFDTKEKITEDGINNFNVSVAPENTILLSFKLTVGRISITTENMATNEAIAQFINPLLPNFFLYLYLKQFSFNTLGNTSSIGQAVNSKIIKKINILIPDEQTLEIFNSLIEPIFSEIKCLESENNKLEQLRDTLLPKLLSGEFELPTEEEV